MSWLLDTNACIDYLKRGTPAIQERLRATKPGDVYLCSIVKSELLYGAYKSQNPERTLRVQRAFFRCFPSLEFDDRCADTLGHIRAELSRNGGLIGPYDMMIAAVAIANGLTLVTNNTREFQRVPHLSIEDWKTAER